jgi:hypothetical protein
VAVFILTLALAIPAWSANVTIPGYQLLTRGSVEGGLFVLQTQADVQVQLGGGYKFGGELTLGLETDDLERQSTPGPTYDQETLTAALSERLGLTSASVIVRDIFSLPLNATYFIGERDRILTGDIFPEQFGTDLVASDFRGLIYFPNGVVYDGVHVMDGTGLQIAAPSLTPWLYLDGAIYQDAFLGSGYYSADVRAAFNTPTFKAETFLGASFPAGSFGAYRGGLLLYYATGEGGEFLTQIGVPRWAPVTDGALNIDDFFFLFEPRVHIGVMSIVLTLFWHPEYYVQAPTNERGATDIIVRLIAGDIQTNVVSGGLESGIRLRPDSTEQQLSVSAAPFVTINSSGVIWDFKADFNLFPFDLADLVTGYVGIRTQF